MKYYSNILSLSLGIYKYQFNIWITTQWRVKAKINRDFSLAYLDLGFLTLEAEW